MTRRPSNDHERYHAHVYFDQATVEHASAICREAGELFGVKVGRVHERPIGPHPRWSCQLAFESSQFEQLIPWLEENRQGLTVLVHARTGDDLADHTEYASWLGEAVELNLSIFRDEA